MKQFFINSLPQRRRTSLHNMIWSLFFSTTTFATSCEYYDEAITSLYRANVRDAHRCVASEINFTVERLSHMPTTGHTPDDTLHVANNYQDRISLNGTAPIERWQKQADLRQPLKTENGRHLGALSYFEAQKAIRLSASARPTCVRETIDSSEYHNPPPYQTVHAY